MQHLFATTTVPLSFDDAEVEVHGTGGDDPIAAVRFGRLTIQCGGPTAGFELAAALRDLADKAEAAHRAWRDACNGESDDPPMHCTEFVDGDPDGCARCGEVADLGSGRHDGAVVP
jgi:hypothetical protein